MEELAAEETGSAGEPAVARWAEGAFRTQDPATLAMLALADRAAATDAPVVVQGESGTGKELVARRIHRASRRALRPFVAINCAAVPDPLAESELFGHERGAFTGAQARHCGLFEQADGGTLFLDEVSELSDAVQGKLLRAVEHPGIRRLGADRQRRVDVRLLAATHRDLAADVAAGTFREDLYYRLAVVVLEVPPLRERPGDLELLVEPLRRELAAELGVGARPLAPAALARLASHRWPGNVRELRNVLERALIAATGEQVEVADLPRDLLEATLAPLAGCSPRSGPLPCGRLAELERTAILAALDDAGGNRRRAAEWLGISLRTLYNRLHEIRGD